MPIADLPFLPKGSGASLLFHLSMEEEGQEERILEEGRRKEGSAGANSFDPGIASRYLSAAS